eukprot:88683-Rhodomonas_salina.1
MPRKLPPAETAFTASSGSIDQPGAVNVSAPLLMLYETHSQSGLSEYARNVFPFAEIPEKSEVKQSKPHSSCTAAQPGDSTKAPASTNESMRDGIWDGTGTVRGGVPTPAT